MFSAPISNSFALSGTTAGNNAAQGFNQKYPLFAMLVQAIHLLFILFVLFGIFSNDPIILLLYLFTLISLQLHWYLNNDICCLTLTEKALTGRTDDESFMHKIVNPIYKIQDKKLGNISKIIVYILILLTLIKFWRLGLTPYKIYEIIKDAFLKAFNR